MNIPATSAASPILLRPLAQFERGEEWRLATLHDRPDYLLIWITKGQGLAYLSGLRLGIGAHTALLVPPDTLFALDLMRSAGGLVLSMPGALAEELNMPHRPRILRLRDVQTQAEITHRLEAIQREASGGAQFCEEAIEAHGALLSVYLRRLLGKLPETARPTGAQRLSEAFCSLVSSYYSRGTSLMDYAKMLGVTPTHLTRSCKEACGMTAADIVTARTLYGARDLVETTPHSFKTIAESLGFGSAAYFSRFIHKHTGKSPSTLRKSARGRQPARH